MRAWYLENYGKENDIKYSYIALGHKSYSRLKPNEVRVKIKYTALNDFDTRLIEKTIPKIKIPKTKIPKSKIPKSKIPKSKIPKEKITKFKIPQKEKNEIRGTERELRKIRKSGLDISKELPTGVQMNKEITTGGDFSNAPVIQDQNFNASFTEGEMIDLPAMQQDLTDSSVIKEEKPNDTMQQNATDSSVTEEEIFDEEDKEDKKMVSRFFIGCEASGIVTRVGKAVKKLKRRDRVVIFPGVSCGECEECLAGRQFYCKDYKVRGIDYDGMMAKKINIPAKNVFKIKDRYPLDEAAATSYTYANAYRILTKIAPVKRNDFVFVENGHEDLGKCLIQVAHLYGARVLTSTNRKEYIDKLKNEYKADEVFISEKETNYLEQSFKFTGGKGIDVIVNAYEENSIVKSLKMLKPDGKLVTLIQNALDRPETKDNQLYWKQIMILEQPLKCDKDDFFKAENLVFEDKLKVHLAKKDKFKPIRRNKRGNKLKFSMYDLDKAREYHENEPYGRILITPKKPLWIRLKNYFVETISALMVLTIVLFSTVI